MKKIWKKWVAANKGTRIILAFLYTYISLTISLNHTCHLACHKTSEYHHEYTNLCHGLSCDSEGKTVLCEIGPASIICPDSQYCPACLYSLLAKSSRLSPKVLPITIEAPSIIQVLAQFNFIKQFEYLSSVSLRAPPSITS